MISRSHSLAHRRGRFVAAALRGGWLVFTLIALVLHAPAALDSAEAGPAPVFAAHGQVDPAVRAAPLSACHHGHHHAHSLCAPPIVLCDCAEWILPRVQAQIPPARGGFLNGRIGRLRHPPPRSFA